VRDSYLEQNPRGKVADLSTEHTKNLVLERKDLWGTKG